MALDKNDMNLVWLDMEMSGLEPDRERIIEVAVVVTDAQCTVRLDGPVFAIHQSDAILDAMDSWNKGTHGRSNNGAPSLIDRVRASKIDDDAASTQLFAFLQQYVGARKSPLCGNSVHQDRRFMVRYMPELEAFFHYRNLDVSTLKELARRWQPDMEKFVKRGEHTALADVHESIDELLHYRKHMLRC